MRPYEFRRFYHPRLGRFVFNHKGSGIIIDNIFKPMQSALSTVFQKVAKPMAKKALESSISHAGDKLGRKAVEKSGDLIMKKLANMRKTQPKIQPKTVRRPVKEESVDMILNRLISGSGIKRR